MKETITTSEDMNPNIELQKINTQSVKTMSDAMKITNNLGSKNVFNDFNDSNSKISLV